MKKPKHNWHLDADGVEVAKGQGESVPDMGEGKTSPRVKFGENWSDAAFRYKAERDQLLSACKLLLKHISGEWIIGPKGKHDRIYPPDKPCNLAISTAQKAIAEAEGRVK